MRDIITLTKRNMLAYLRDKAAVFFSFLSVLILLAVYLLFLGNMFSDIGVLTQAQKTVFMAGYIMGGVLVVSTITLSMGVIGTYVADSDAKKLNGFLVAPIKRYKITLAYYITTTIVTAVLTLLMFVLVFLYVGLIGGYWYGFLQVLNILATLLLYVFISTPIMIFIVSFIKSMNAFGGVSAIVGTLIGFIAGIYVPLTVLDPSIQSVAGLLPFSHMTLYLRKLLIGDAVFNLLPNDILYSTGLQNIEVFGASLPMWIVLLVATILSFGLLILAYLKSTKKQVK